MSRQEDALRRIIIREITALGGLAGERGGNSSARYLPGGQRVQLNVQKLSGMEQIEFPEADSPVNDFSDHSLHLSPRVSSKLANTVMRDPDTGELVFVDANKVGSGEGLGVPGMDAEDDTPRLREVIRRELRHYLREASERVNWSRERDEDGSEPLGLVPKQMSDYELIRSEMKPQTFLRLALRGGDVSEYMVNAMADGEPIAPPFLKMVYVTDPGVWYVSGHEGRHRARSAIRYASPSSIPVDLFTYIRRPSDRYPSSIPPKHLPAGAMDRITSDVVTEDRARSVSEYGDVLQTLASPADIRVIS